MLAIAFPWWWRAGGGPPPADILLDLQKKGERRAVLPGRPRLYNKQDSFAMPSHFTQQH